MKIDIRHPFGQFSGGFLGRAAIGEGAIGLHPGQLIIKHLLRHEHVAEMLLLLVHPEGDADGDQQLWIPVVNGLRGAELRLLGALAAVPVDHAEVPDPIEFVIGHPLPRQLVADAAEFRPQLVGLVFIEGEQQGDGRAARFVGFRNVLPGGRNGVQFRRGDGWRPVVHPLEPEEPGLGADLLRISDSESERHLCLSAEPFDLFSKTS